MRRWLTTHLLIDMNINILQNELDELIEFSELFAEHNFSARREALVFLQMVSQISVTGNHESRELKRRARIFSERLRTFNGYLAQDFYQRLKSQHPLPTDFRSWLAPYTNYVPKDWGKPHYGYESLDFLLDAVLLPEPQPEPNLKSEYGMVRYQPTPASVVLELTERIQFTDNDLFCDLGAGLGKVTMLVHLLTQVQTVGVEYQSSFCDYAERQAQDLGLTRISYLNLNARNADYSDATVFFFFNPFGGLIFDSVLEKLRLEAEKREITLCSYGSSSQPLSELTWLERLPPVSEDEMALEIFRGIV